MTSVMDPSSKVSSGVQAALYDAPDSLFLLTHLLRWPFAPYEWTKECSLADMTSCLDLFGDGSVSKFPECPNLYQKSLHAPLTLKSFVRLTFSTSVQIFALASISS